MQHLRAYAERTDTAGEAGSPIRFVASTEGVKGDGMNLLASDWSLDRFRSNPLVLWSHDFFGNRPPIGRASASVEGKALMADVTFDQEDEFARTIESKYRRGFLNAVSVSWDVVNERNELLEISAVPIPMDPQALMERQKRGLADLSNAITKIIDDDTQQPTTDAEALWVGTAYQMVRLFRADASEAESVRLQTYRRLNRCYERQGKTAPEFMGAAELAALDAETWRGLFLAGEADVVPELFVRSVEPPADDTAAALSAALARLQSTLGVTQ